MTARRRFGWVAAEVDGCPTQSPMRATTGQPRPCGYRGSVTRPLEIAGCRRLCSWRETGQQLAGEPLFACSGCGSEWVPSQPWTPIDYEGVVPAPVAEARRTRGRG